MRHASTNYVWMGSHRVEREARTPLSEGLWKKLWDHGWGLLFVIAMTLLSILGPRTTYSKLPPAQVANPPAIHDVK